MEGTVSNPGELDTITIYATSEAQAANAGKSALPPECTVGTLLGAVTTGTITGLFLALEPARVLSLAQLVARALQQ